MDSPGYYSLAALTVTTAIAGQQQTAITDLDGMTGVTLEAAFTGGTGGTSLTALIRSRMGSGGTWREIARFDFTTAASKSCTVRADPSGIVTLSTLGSDTVLQEGFLGTELQAVISSVGTYVDSTLAIRASVR